MEHCACACPFSYFTGWTFLFVCLLSTHTHTHTHTHTCTHACTHRHSIPNYPVMQFCIFVYWLCVLCMDEWVPGTRTTHDHNYCSNGLLHTCAHTHTHTVTHTHTHTHTLHLSWCVSRCLLGYMIMDTLLHIPRLRGAVVGLGCNVQPTQFQSM